MERISLNNSPVTKMTDILKEEENSKYNIPIKGPIDLSKASKQNNEYKILNPQSLEKKLYNSFDKICDGPYCSDCCSDNCDI